MSEVSIVNQALALLGQGAIISLDDDTNAAKVSKQMYAPVRDALLEMHNWKFATTWQSLPRSPSASVSEYANIFPIPSNILRIIWVGSAGDKSSVIDYDIDSTGIITDSKTCVIEAVVQVTDTTKYSPLFVQALAARLAADMGIAITASASLSQAMYQVFNVKMREATQRDSIQGSSKKIQSNWIQANRGGRGNRLGGTV